MTSISASGTVYIRQDNQDIQYQINSTIGSWITITDWPVNISNIDLSTTLQVVFTTNITLTTNLQYFNHRLPIERKAEA